MTSSLNRAPYGRLPDGTAVDRFTLANGAIEVDILSYGGIVAAIRAPDRFGHRANIALGLPSLEAYLDHNRFFGAITGRYANRLAHARFTLDGSTYRLAANHGQHALHGGLRGFDKALWQAQPFERNEVVGVSLTHTSPDGEEGYPGTLEVQVTYTLSAAGELRIDYLATTNRPTVLNLTNHSYFNLAGESSGDVLGHELTILADHYTPTDADSIPTGEIASVSDTPFDFRVATPIGERISHPHPQLLQARGYDHNYVLRKSGHQAPEPGARVVEPRSGRILEVATTEPGVQLYTGNYLLGDVVGSGGRIYRQSAGFCLETQHFPDSPNRPEFPTTVLRPGERFSSTTIFRFGIVP